jgi:uncharacterized protein (UPF0297 family)
MCCTAQAQGPDTLIFGTTHERGSAAYNYAVDYLHGVRGDPAALPAAKPARTRGTAMLADGSIVGELGRVKEYIRNTIRGNRSSSVHLPFTRASHNSWEEVARRCAPSATSAASNQKGWKRGGGAPHDVQTVTACLQWYEWARLRGRRRARPQGAHAAAAGNWRCIFISARTTPC